MRISIKKENNFQNFYEKIKDFIENKIELESNFDYEFKDIITRLLRRLENR